jgi:aminopeptidase N
MVKLAEYTPPAFEIPKTDLDVALDAARTVVKNRMRIRRANGTPATAPLRLDGVRMELLRVALNGEALGPNRYSVDAEGLTLADVPDDFELEIDTAFSPAKNTTRLGLFELGGQLASQCEAEGYRSITYGLDRPDVLSTYRVKLTGDKTKYPHLLSNGNKIAGGEGEGGQHWATWDDPFPKPSYIFAIMAGDWGVLEDTYTTKSGRKVAIGIYADKDLIPRCDFAMQVVKRSFQWDEDTYGLEYDLDTFAIVALTGWAGAMENKGLNLFEAHGIITDPEITTDNDYVIIERIIGHEQFHNWTGNRVTCRDWFQLCLKEGLTRFRDQHFIEDKMAEGVWRVEIVQQLRRNQFPEDEGANAHAIQPAAYADIDNFYTNTVYDKGAEVIRMLRALLGPKTFRAGFDRYIAANDGKAATTNDFVSAMEQASGRDLSQFRGWYHQAGRPRVTARGTYDAAAKRYTLNLAQVCPPTPGQSYKDPFHIPIAAGLIARDGKALTFATGGSRTGATVIELTKPEQTVVFDDVVSEPIPSLLRGFSAPISLDAGLSDDDLATLLSADSDPFARWDAAQTLSVRLVRRLAADRAAGKQMQVPESFIAAMGRVLDASHIDKLARAHLLTIPDEPMLSEGLTRIDLDGHMAARALLRQTIATRFNQKLRDLYDANRETGAYAPDIEGISRRKFRNTILDLLTSLGSEDAAGLALTQVKTARNMTDQFEALCYLTHLDRPEHTEAVAWFYDRWKSHSTVVDKWFNAQALSRAPGAVDRITALEEHPAFDFNNMARGMLYYGGFFRQNRVAFHDITGKGYEFLADRLLMIDKLGRAGSTYIMPQINQWRRYDDKRQSLMRAALERVANTEGISKGLRENIDKALT